MTEQNAVNLSNPAPHNYYGITYSHQPVDYVIDAG